MTGRRGYSPRMAGLMVLLGSLSACAVGPDFDPPQPQVPDSFASAPADAATVNVSQWWRSMNDELLNSLVEQAVIANPDIEIALTRMQQARSQEAVLLGAALPVADSAAGAGNGTGSDLTRGRVPSPLTAGDNTAHMKVIHQVSGFDAGWELDLFGRMRRSIEAGSYDAAASAEARNQVLVTIISDVVRAYVDLRGTQNRVNVLRKNIAVAQKSRDFVMLRFERGLTNELDLTLAERELATLQADEAPLLAQIEAAQYTLAALLGQFPEQLGIDLTQTADIPTLPARINPGIPLDLVQRRPDIRQAEWELAGATARVGVATANLFPRLSLTGGIGEQSAAIGAEQAAHLWSIGPSAYWPLLDFGTLDALIDIADQQTHLQLVTYKRTVINAVRDVDQSISDFSAQQNRVKNLGNAVVDSRRAVALATARYDQGLTDFLNVVDAERQQYAIEAQYVAAQQAAAENFVAVFKSLGGGWENYPQTPPVRRPHPALEAMFERLWTSVDHHLTTQ